MNTKKVTVIVLVVIALVVLGVLTLLVRAPKMENPNQPIGTPVAETQNGTIAELIARDANVQCTYTIDDPQIGKGSGVVYIDQNGRVRNETTVTNPDGEARMHVLNDSVWLYTWTESEKITFGTKMRLSEEATMESLKETPIASAHTMYKNVSYTCAPWEVDEVMFIPPMEIKFNDLATTIADIVNRTTQSSE